MLGRLKRLNSPIRLTVTQVSEDMDYPVELIDSMRQRSAEAKETAAALKAQAEQAVQIETVWGDLLTFVDRDWPLHILSLLDKRSSLLKDMRLSARPGIPELEQLYRLTKEHSKAVLRRFPLDLEQACRAGNLPLDPESRHPRYTFDQRFLQLEIDEQKGMARLSDNEGTLVQLPADVPAIVEKLQAERKRICGRRFDGKKFLKTLRTHYLAIIKKESRQDEASVPIRQITRRMGKNVKRFRTDEFIFDLSRLVDQGPLEVEGFRLDLQQTKDTNQGILLHGKAGRGYIGFIVFRRV